MRSLTAHGWGMSKVTMTSCRAVLSVTKPKGGWPTHKTHPNIGCPIHAVSPQEWAIRAEREPLSSRTR